VLDHVLNPGDLLYFPRGWIHQAVSPEGAHSLHATVSTGLHNNWLDLLQYAMPRALDLAGENEVALRGSVPRDLLQFAGIINSDPGPDEDVVKEARLGFVNQAKVLAKLVLRHLPGVLDQAADQVARELMHSRLPPPLAGEEMPGRFGESGAPEAVGPNSMIRLTRREAARLVLEEEQAVLYHCVQNSRVHRAEEPKGIVFDIDQAPAVEAVLSAYPEPIMVAQLPMGDLQDRLDVALTLYEQGIVLFMGEAKDTDMKAE